MRLAICGAPRAGKSTLAALIGAELGLPVVCTDDYRTHPWPTVPDLVLRDIRDRESWILEGTQAARVLRRWLNERGANPMLQSVYWLDKPVLELTEGQATMAKGIRTVFADVRPLLNKLGIPVLPGFPPAYQAQPRQGIAP